MQSTNRRSDRCPDSAHLHLFEQGHQATDMIVVRMRGYYHIYPVDPIISQKGQQHARTVIKMSTARAGVHYHGFAIGKAQEYPVALAHI